MTFSASRLNAFVTCGRRWFFEYLCDAVEDRGSIHATYGKVVHGALEALHRDVREPAAVDPRAYLEAVRSGDEAQLALYYFMRRARGDEVASVALVSIRDIHDGVRVLALDIVEDGADAPPSRRGAAACSRAVLDASLAALIRRCDLLTKEGLEHFDVGEDPPCRFCVYLPACRERPAESESIFVR